MKNKIYCNYCGYKGFRLSIIIAGLMMIASISGLVIISLNINLIFTISLLGVLLATIIIFLIAINYAYKAIIVEGDNVIIQSLFSKKKIKTGDIYCVEKNIFQMITETEIIRYSIYLDEKVYESMSDKRSIKKCSSSKIIYIDNIDQREKEVIERYLESFFNRKIIKVYFAIYRLKGKRIIHTTLNEGEHELFCKHHKSVYLIPKTRLAIIFVVLAVATPYFFGAADSIVKIVLLTVLSLILIVIIIAFSTGELTLADEKIFLHSLLKKEEECISNIESIESTKRKYIIAFKNPTGTNWYVIKNKDTEKFLKLFWKTPIYRKKSHKL